MQELNPQDVKIHDAFWSARLRINAEQAIFHQWQMLETSGCIDNFRIAAGEKGGLHEGWFFADSDATKWLDAAARIERNHHDDALCQLMDDFIRLLEKAQSSDGYLFTYNQICFPGQRWVNLQIEHELYCHGHLIEAGVSHFEATGRWDMLNIACRAADLLVHDFMGAGPERTPGHEEVEIALLRLWQLTRHELYRELAKQFLEQRGRIAFFGLKLIKQFISNTKKEKQIKLTREQYYKRLRAQKPARVPAMNQAVRPHFSMLRFYLNSLSGRYFQQHKPIQKQNEPVGHAVRFGYLETAQAMLIRSQPDEKLSATLQQAWEHMVSWRMDVTGGLGALPDSEGFGRDFELNPETAYNETCAAIASLYWNWQMVLLSAEAKYSDLFERQLYNAVSVGMGWKGDHYFYNNPTLSRGGITRQPWYSIPCCPSNLSRTYADLSKYIFSYDEKNIWVHQYIGCGSALISQSGVRLQIESMLPWQGNVKIKVRVTKPQTITLWLRIPSWAEKTTVQVNGVKVENVKAASAAKENTASGMDPRLAYFLPIERSWQDGDSISIAFEMAVKVVHPDQRVLALRHRAAVTRGPLVYCLESVDNAGVDLFDAPLDVHSLVLQEEPELFGGITEIVGKTLAGERLVFIPYALWGNRGTSQMNVWLKI